MKRAIEIIRLEGFTGYEEAWRRQVDRRNAVEKGRAGSALFLLEHPPVITLGRKSDPANILLAPEQLAEQGIQVVETDRGGDVTYHGPGQLVAYPILDLRCWRESYRWYLRSLEAVLIRLLEGYGLEAGRVEGFTGAWVQGKKVAAVGVGVHNWVSFHGIALNVDPDMEHFKLIVPCGIADKPVASLRTFLEQPPSMAQVMRDFERAFLDYFEVPDDDPAPEP